jgi:hypothetical protein
LMMAKASVSPELSLELPLELHAFAVVENL